uniref:Uncharacterized protein n=1 Tax=Cacopsylla melanoneura TaxID=428564 RepID=A0A8D8TRQ8_9HEMI
MKLEYILCLAKSSGCLHLQFINPSQSNSKDTSSLLSSPHRLSVFPVPYLDPSSHLEYPVPAPAPSFFYSRFYPVYPVLLLIPVSVYHFHLHPPVPPVSHLHHFYSQPQAPLQHLSSVYCPYTRYPVSRTYRTLH